MSYPLTPRYLHAAPMFHLGDLSQAFMATLLGGTHIFIPGFNADEVVRVIARHRVQTTLLVPTMIGMVLQSPLLDGADLSSLELIAYGGSPISDPVLKRAREVFSRTRLVQGFGQTESCAAGTLLADRYHVPGGSGDKMRSAGRPSYGVEIAMRAPDGAFLGPGEVGEICLRGPMVMAGYWNKPEETATALRDGWLHTGDAGYLDDDGFLYVCDRVKDMIISGGENVYSAEVERAVATHPKVAQVAVIGVPDEKWGERVHAVIVAKPGETPTYEEIYAHCKALIAGYKTPRSMEVLAALPLSPVGKVLKTELRKPYWGDNRRAVN
jgi:long-chain acyl-CoA synthetase